VTIKRGNLGMAEYSRVFKSKTKKQLGGGHDQLIMNMTFGIEDE
jgi:hypothetical protein